jgi:isopentenyl-diphosphate delta-isomerase
VEYRADVGGGLIEHEVVDIFVGEVAADDQPQPNPEEVMDTIWVPLADLAEKVIERPRCSRPGCGSTCVTMPA